MLETAEQHNAKLTGKVVIPEPPVIIEVPAPEQPKPKGRNVVTEMCYPYKMTLHEFMDELEKAKEPFTKNMENMLFGKDEKWPEDWMVIFIDWIEMVKEKE